MLESRRRPPPRPVPRERGVNVAVGQDDRARVERGDHLPLHAVGQVGGVDQAEGQRGQQLFPLAPLCGPATRGEEFHSVKATR